MGYGSERCEKNKVSGHLKRVRPDPPKIMGALRVALGWTGLRDEPAANETSVCILTANTRTGHVGTP